MRQGKRVKFPNLSLQFSKQGPTRPRVTQHLPQASPAVPSIEPKRVSRYTLDHSIFRYIRHLFEETYGLFLKRDVFASSNRFGLPTFGFPRSGVVENTVLINANFYRYAEIFSWLLHTKVVALIIAPPIGRITLV